MAVLHLSLGSLNLDLHAFLRKVSIKYSTYVLVAQQYEEASSYSILMKFNFCNFILWMHPCLGCPEPSLRLSALCTPLWKGR